MSFCRQFTALKHDTRAHTLTRAQLLAQITVMTGDNTTICPHQNEQTSYNTYTYYYSIVYYYRSVESPSRLWKWHSIVYSKMAAFHV